MCNFWVQRIAWPEKDGNNKWSAVFENYFCEDTQKWSALLNREQKNYTCSVNSHVCIAISSHIKSASKMLL